MEFESWRRSTSAIKRPPPDAVYTPIDGTSLTHYSLCACSFTSYKQRSYTGYGLCSFNVS
jgi:hypothetical protein